MDYFLLMATVVISLGGSLIHPENVDVLFLKNFKSLINKFTSKGYRFVIYCGGGKLARKMQDAAAKITKLENIELDWLGIHATRLNAELVKTIFRKDAEDTLIVNPNDRIKFTKKIIVACGWLPGWSTDFDAVLAAKNLGIKEMINMSNVDFVYDKDPRKFKDAKKLGKIKWKDFRKLIDGEWHAGMNAPFDPIAAKEAEKIKMKVNFIGKDLKNLEKLLNGKDFIGTVIE